MIPRVGQVVSFNIITPSDNMGTLTHIETLVNGYVSMVDLHNGVVYINILGLSKYIELEIGYYNKLQLNFNLN